MSSPPAPSTCKAEHALEETSLSNGEKRWRWRFDPDIYQKLEFCQVWGAFAAPRCPMAYVRGEFSNVFTDELVALQQRHAPPGSPFLVVPNAAHHVMADQPLALVDTLIELLGTPAR